jgi:hypothetical protein
MGRFSDRAIGVSDPQEPLTVVACASRRTLIAGSLPSNRGALRLPAPIPASQGRHVMRDYACVYRVCDPAPVRVGSWIPSRDRSFVRP